MANSPAVLDGYLSLSGGKLRIVDGNARLIDQLRDDLYPSKAEWAILFEIEAWDINCPQHIHKRFSKRQIAPMIQQLQSRITELEARLREAEFKKS